MTVATRATKPVAKTGLVAPEPFVDVKVVVLAGVGIDMPDMDTVMDMPVADVPDAVEGEPVDVPPMGAVDWLLISAWTDAFNERPTHAAQTFQKTSARIDMKEYPDAREHG